MACTEFGKTCIVNNPDLSFNLLQQSIHLDGIRLSRTVATTRSGGLLDIIYSLTLPTNTIMVDYDLFLKQTAGRVSVITGELAICHRTLKHIPKETVESLSNENMFLLGMSLGGLMKAAKEYCEAVNLIAGLENDPNAFNFTIPPPEDESDSTPDLPLPG